MRGFERQEGVARRGRLAREAPPAAAQHRHGQERRDPDAQRASAPPGVVPVQTASLIGKYGSRGRRGKRLPGPSGPLRSR